MKNWGNLVATLAISIAALCAAAIAGPATKPTAKPAGTKKTSVAADNTVYKCESLGFQFQLPKSIKLDSRNSTPTRFRFDLAADNQGAHSSKDIFKTEEISITGGQACHGELTLDVQVANMRDHKDDKGNTPKILKDEPATLAGIPARRFTIEVVTRWTETGPGTGPKIHDVKTRQEHLVAIKDGQLFDLCLDCDPNTFNQRSKLFGRAIDSFEWTEKPAPADQKK